MIDFATAGIALYAGHHVGDYWIQRDDTDARRKGLPGWTGRLACARHVTSYVLTQSVFLAVVQAVLGQPASVWRGVLALAISGVTHYLADRREHGLMFKLAKVMPGKRDFLVFGSGLATGAWALDQAWHIVFSVFVPALVIGS